MKTTFSVIIPFYNGDKFYTNLLRSIQRAIIKCCSQKCFFEIITIIDSVDSSLEDIDNISRSVFSEKMNVVSITLKNDFNIGVAATRNRAILIAKGYFLHIIDQDDEVSENIYFESQKYLNKYNFILFNGVMCYRYGKFNKHKLYYLPPKLSIKGLINDDFIRSPGQVIFSKELLCDKLFPEPKLYKGADDRFFWLRLFFEKKNNIKSKYVNEECYIANIHDNNYSNDRINLKRSCLENWDIFISEVDIGPYSKLILNDILRVSYILDEEMSFLNQVKGIYLQFVFNFKLSKMIRYVVKRV
jgi:hypothetical protein